MGVTDNEYMENVDVVECEEDECCEDDGEGKEDNCNDVEDDDNVSLAAL